MRKFNIKVNGKAYEVEVEEVGGTPSIAVPVQAAVAAPVAASASAAPAGSTEIKAPMPGTIISVSVAKGDTVKEGDVLCILEAMKMENEIKATCAGTVVVVGVVKGASVNSGELLAAIG